MIRRGGGKSSGLERDHYNDGYREPKTRKPAKMFHLFLEGQRYGLVKEISITKPLTRASPVDHYVYVRQIWNRIQRHNPEIWGMIQGITVTVDEEARQYTIDAVLAKLI